jgi:hypothetical protein
MNDTKIFEFDVKGHSTRQEWAVYIVVATHLENFSKKIYVGKVGDNRKGCNPLISRIGNHFSLNPIHSQIRNKIGTPTEFDYKVFYFPFENYDADVHKEGRDRVNEFERRLNILVQELIESSEETNLELMNPLKGTGFIDKKEKEKRLNLLNEEDLSVLRILAIAALK